MPLSSTQHVHRIIAGAAFPDEEGKAVWALWDATGAQR
jgi:hypothetical protein